MREPDNENQDAQHPKNLGKGSSHLEQARELFHKMSGEAKRQARLERKTAQGRGRVAKSLLRLTLIAVLLAVAIGFYGIYNFPDAPIRPTDRGYVGKTGKQHTEAEYEAFSVWKKAMFIVFGSAFVLGLAFGIADSRSRRNAPRR